MAKKEIPPYLHDFTIDKITNSILNTVSGDSFETEVHRLAKPDLKQTLKKFGWNFDWKKELLQHDKEVYKLVISSSPLIIQGLLSVSIQQDHIFMNLLESAPFNIMRVFPAILLLLPVNYLFKEALMAS